MTINNVHEAHWRCCFYAPSVLVLLWRFTVLLPSSSHTRCQSDPGGALLPVTSITLASHCLHQSLILWRDERSWSVSQSCKSAHICNTERWFSALCAASWWVLAVSRRNMWISETERGYWGRVSTVWGTQETGNYPQFTSWLAGVDYKRIVFFPAWQQANTEQM